MTLKINVGNIVRYHLLTLVDAGGVRSKEDIEVFYILPALCAAALVVLDRLLSNTTSSIFTTVLAIFAGLLFNLLLLIHNIAQTGRSDAEKTRTERAVLCQVYANIAYAILVAIVTLLVLLTGVIFPKTWLQVQRGVSFMAYFLVGNFTLTLLMVLKRIHAMLAEEFRDG